MIEIHNSRSDGIKSRDIIATTEAVVISLNLQTRHKLGQHKFQTSIKCCIVRLSY